MNLIDYVRSSRNSGDNGVHENVVIKSTSGVDNIDYSNATVSVGDAQVSLVAFDEVATMLNGVIGPVFGVVLFLSGLNVVMYYIKKHVIDVDYDDV